jgi:hypothetical protein
MHTRHQNLRVIAKHLQTASTPPIVSWLLDVKHLVARLLTQLQLYRPWELTEDQENKIKKQIQGTEDLIRDDERIFKANKEKRLRDLDVAVQPSEPNSKDGEPARECSNVSPTHSPSRPSSAKTVQDKDHDERELVTEEDTVIY